MTINRQDIERSQELQDRVLQLWECPVEFGSLWHRGVLQSDGVRRKRYSQLHKDIAAHALSSNRSSTIVSRNHGKTTIFMDIAFWSKWRHPDKRIMYMSASTQLACEILGELKAVTAGDIELLPGLLVPFEACFPELMPVKAPSGSPPASFNVSGRSGTGREPCFFPSSIGSNKAGKHPTDIFVDDPANEKNSTTPVQREKVIHSMKQLEPILRDPQDGAIRHIGTPWAFQDVATWLGDNPEYEQFRFGCWDGVNPSTGQADGTGPGPNGAWPLCAEYMTGAELLEAESTVDDAEFWSQQYLCKPIAAANALFDDSLLRAATNKIADLSAVPPGLNILLWDPTSRADAQVGDWNGLVVVRVTTADHVREACKTNPALAIPGLAEMPREANIFYVIEAAELKGPPADCMPVVREIHERLGIDQLWVEDTGAASWVKNWVHDHHWAAGIKAIPIKIGSRGASKDRRLQGTQLALKENRLRLVSSAPGYGALTKRLTEFPKSESDDLPDALALLTWGGARKGALPNIPLAKGPNMCNNPRSPYWQPPNSPARNKSRKW